MATCSLFGAFRASFVGFSALALCGCFATTPPIRAKSETEIAVESIKAEWLAPCTGIGPAKENNIGALLQDYVDVAAALAECMKRHNDFVDYMAPVVAKQKKM